MTSISNNNKAVMNGQVVSDPPMSSNVLRPKELEDPPVDQIERELDELTYSGAAINDLEVQLIRTKDMYQKILIEGRHLVDTLRRKLHSHILKSEPFIEIWRKAKQIQEESNKAAARYDKVNSQHTASMEMIRVAESQLAACREEHKSAACEEPSCPSPLDLAWQEMLNHATSKVVVTAKDRRDSEIEHRRVMEECNRVMERYRITERKLHSNVVKSRPYYEERYRVNQLLAKHRSIIKDLEQKITESKKSYSASLKRLEVLNSEIHHRRNTTSDKYLLDPREVLSSGNTPELRRTSDGLLSIRGRNVDTVSMDSLQMSDVGDQFGGSGTSLPSIGTNSDQSSSPELDKYSPPPPLPPQQAQGMSPDTSPSPLIVVAPPDIKICTDDKEHNVVSELVDQCLASAVRKLQLEDYSPFNDHNPISSSSSSDHNASPLSSLPHHKPPPTMPHPIIAPLHDDPIL